VDINSNLKVSGRSQTHSRSSQLAGKAIVVFEVALSALLLVGAGLFLRTLVNLQAVRLGFNPQRLVLFTVDPPRNRYTGEKRIAFFQKLEEGIAALPTVESSTLTNIALISNSTSTTTITPPHTSNPIRVWLNHTGDQFFQTMQIPILQGRAFDTHDRQNSPRVVVINESLAKAFFGQSNPMGQTLGEGKNSRGTIIGICRDVKYKDLRQAPPPTAYFPYKQEREIGSLTVAVRTHAGPVSIVAAARQIVADLDKDVPILDVRTQTEQINASLKTERLFAALTAGVGLLAVLLACVGVYGVMAYTVTRRTNEIGIRMALGAVSGEVLRMILRETALLATAGIAAGVALSVGMTRLVASMLYGLGPNDPITLTSTLVLMLVVTLLAGWIPARRASRVDPMVALRQE
jgi:predicted permease